MDLETQITAASLFRELDPPSIEEVNLPRLLLCLRQNRVRLAALSDSPVLKLLKRYPEYEDMLQKECKHHGTALIEFSRGHVEWKRKGIDSVLIKSPGHFPNTSDNVDVLVHSDCAELAETVLRRLGYVELPYIREPHKTLFGKFHGANLWFPIHLHTCVEWVNMFLTDEEVLSSCRQLEFIPAVYYRSVGNSLLITTAHWFYEDKELKLRDVYHTSRALCEKIDWERAEETETNGY